VNLHPVDLGGKRPEQLQTKTCLAGINAAIRQYLAMLPTIPGGKEQSKKLREVLILPQNSFEYRWAAD